MKYKCYQIIAFSEANKHSTVFLEKIQLVAGRPSLILNAKSALFYYVAAQDSSSCNINCKHIAAF